MKTTIDGAGRLVLPKVIRESAGLYAGAEVEISLLDGDIIQLQPAPCSVRIEQRGHRFVALPIDPIPELTEDLVQAVREGLRGERFHTQGLAVPEP